MDYHDTNFLLFQLNFSLFSRIHRYKIGCDLPGKYRVALDSDAFEFGGHGRVRFIMIHDFLGFITSLGACDFGLIC